MKAVADTLAVARSNLIERVIGPARLRGLYRKSADAPLLALIRRPTTSGRPMAIGGSPPCQSAAKGRRKAEDQCQTGAPYHAG